MPQKTLVKRVQTKDIQGEGTYVVVRALTWGEQKAFRREAEARVDPDEQLIEATLASRVIEWNWSDENEVPLPLPKDDPTVLDRLTDEELTCLTRAIFGTAKEGSKN